jgi:SAM-dependent methyltransferase
MTTEHTNPVAHNREAWDRLATGGCEWSKPVSPDVIVKARAGEWSVVLIGYEPVPRDWFPASLRGVDLLGLASGGGQQGPVFAAAGANVTIFDNSPQQLARDRDVAQREGLQMRTEQGDMRDLSVFPESSFDVIFHPVSNLFAPDILPVWRECFRVLRPGGILMAGFMNPDLWIFDADALDNRREFVVRHRIPYSDLTHLSPDERERVFGKDAPIEYSHTMTEQIDGQLRAGFILTHFREAPHHNQPTAAYMPGYFATRAVKPANNT